MLKKVENTIFWISFPFAFFSFILPIYADALGASPIEIGYLFSIFSFMSIILRPFVGRYIDRSGRKGALILGLTLYALVQGILYLGNSYISLFLARIIQSMAASFLWVSIHTMVADLSTSGHTATNYGSLIQTSSRSEFIGCILGFTLLFKYQADMAFKTTFGIFFLLSVYAIYLGVTTLKETRPTQAKESSSDNISGQFKLYIFLMGVLSLVSSMISPMFLIYIKNKLSLEYSLLSYAYIPGAILAIFLPAKIGKLADQHGKKKFMFIGMICSGIITLVIPSLRSFTSFVILNLCLGAAGILRGPAMTSLVSEMTNGNRFGRAYGYYHTATGLGGMIGPMIGTYIYQFVSPSSIFYVNGIAQIMMGVILLLVIKETLLHHNTGISKTV